MIEKINQGLIDSMKSSIPKNENLANVLIDILHIGKESVYRRLRGEVPFSFEEVIKISRKLKISLDNLVDTGKDHTVFSLDLIPSDNLLDDYYKVLKAYISFFTKIGKTQGSQIRLAFNTLPYMFYMDYPLLAKFRLYRWVYQLQENGISVSFSDFKLSQKMVEVHREFITAYSFIPQIQVILDRNAFISFMIEIKYFYKLNLINKDDYQQLRKEFQDMVSNFELITKKGFNRQGNEILIYISNINFETCYIHYELDEHQFYSYIRLYSIDTLSSQNPIVANLHKRWIESLKRFSTLITRSGEIERIEFFSMQNEMIDKLLN